MQPQAIYPQLNEIFRDTFDDDTIDLTPNTTAHDIKDWDSVNHINLIVAIEEQFHIKLKTAELESLKDVGEMVRLISLKTGS
jgi:acyl carrier protein